MKPGLDERRLRDLRRRMGDVAKKSAERRYPDPYVGRRHTVKITIDTEDTDDLPDLLPVSCGMSCECCCEGPHREQGHRSHADGARALANELGLNRCVVKVRVRCVQRRPARFEPEKVEVLALA